MQYQLYLWFFKKQVNYYDKPLPPKQEWSGREVIDTEEEVNWILEDIGMQQTHINTYNPDGRNQDALESGWYVNIYTIEGEQVDWQLPDPYAANPNHQERQKNQRPVRTVQHRYTARRGYTRCLADMEDAREYIGTQANQWAIKDSSIGPKDVVAYDDLLNNELRKQSNKEKSWKNEKKKHQYN
jgi:hypothetical protein